MVEIQVNTAALAAVAGQGGATPGAEPNAAGFFAQALAAASGAGAQADVAGQAGQPLLPALPPGFLAAQIAGARLGAAAQAIKSAQAAQAADSLRSGRAQNDQAASALFDKLAAQLAALGAGNGDPKQVAAQLTAQGLSRGDFKQLVTQAAQENGAELDAKSLESALQQLAQDLIAGRAADPAALGNVAAQLAAALGAGATAGKPEKPADIAVDRKGLPAVGVKQAGEPGVGKPSGDMAASKVVAGSAAEPGLTFAEQMAAEFGAGDDGAVPLQLLEGRGTIAQAMTEAAGLPVAGASNQADAGAVRVDGLGVATPKGAPNAVAQETLLVRTPVRAPGWEGDFAQKVVWMVGRDSQSAQLILNPPQLGAIEVRLTLSGGEAGAQFFSPHPGVREAIESAMPRLREMMAESGLSLGQASVSSESFRDPRANADGSGKFAAGGENAEAQEAQGALLAAQSHPATLGRGLVDLYA